MYKLLYILLLLHLFDEVVVQESRVDPLVETRLGLIRGVKADTYAKFLGIPYAVVDEANPFSQSTPHGSFDETFNAYDDTVKCPQIGHDGLATGQIQCLNLNVYVPNSASSQNRLPVMVYIHGGAFVEGSGGNEIGTPELLVKKDVIFVSINYRVQIYGFFCTDSPKAPGNIGLKDQLNGLRWIKDNIDSFGGDPDKITIFGESAGGMSVHLHLLSHYENLFSGVIIESGPATSPLSIVPLDNSLPLRVAADLGFVTDSVDDAIDFISRADVHLAVAAGGRLKSSTIYTSEPLTKACVEKEFDGIERFLSQNPNELKPEKVRTIPVMIGFCSQEMIFQHGGETEDFFNSYSFKDMLSFGFKVDGLDDMVDTIRQFYIGDMPTSVDLADNITSYASDFTFNHPTERAVKAMLDVGPKAVYHYVFSYGEGNPFGESNIDIKGVAHTSELFYLFDSPPTNERTDEDEKMIERLTTLWTNFAKYGDPTPETSELLPVKWEPVSKETLFYLNIDKDMTLEKRPFYDRMAFWDVFYKLNYQNTMWYDE